AGAAAENIRNAIEGVAPALEIVDWKGARLDLASLAESSSFHAGFVTGRLRPLGDVPAIREGCPLLTRGDEILGVPDPALVPPAAARAATNVTSATLSGRPWGIAGGGRAGSLDARAIAIQ